MLVAGRDLPAPDPEQVDQLGVRNHPLEELHRLASGSLLAPQLPPDRAAASRTHGFDTEFFDIPVVTDFFRWKVRRYLGTPGLVLLRVANPDTFPRALRTNFYVKARLARPS